MAGWEWDVAAVIAVAGWFLSPAITALLPKILSYIGSDASKKLSELEIHIIPELQRTLRDVDQKRMLDIGKKVKSDVNPLDTIAATLRHAWEDAEDIFDDAQHKIESPGSRSCWHRLYGAVYTCILRCVGIACIFWGQAARLLQWARSCDRFRLLGRQEESLPVTSPAEPVPVPASAAPSDEDVSAAAIPAPSYEQVVPAATIAATSDEPPAPVTAFWNSSGRWFSCLHSSFHFFKNCCRSIFYWLVHTFGDACFYRDWSYEMIGITSYKENALDSFLTAISRRNLKKRIEKIEITISEVKRSPLLGLGIESDSASVDIINKNRSRIRTASNRKVFGREALRDSIIAKLREIPDDDAPSSSTSPCYSVIAIYGVSGSGKTTFVQYTRDYIMEECKEENLFDIIMCIHLSQTFSVDDIFHEMLKDITKDRHSQISDREDLEEKLKKSLRGKRFLLILDDLWVQTKNDPQLEELISPLNVGMKGSKILVTARRKDTARALCGAEPMKIPDLDEDQYFSMFMHYALGGTSDAGEEFSRVGRVIAEKLHGSPIAAVIVAGRLGVNPDISFWKDTAKHGMLNDFMYPLWWSYRQLNPDTRRCLDYCNVFPRRFKLERSKLVRMWIAQGFVKTSCATEDMEDVAEGYIRELVSCSFLQPEGTSHYSFLDCSEDLFTVHDLLHDLLEKVTTSDYFRIENERTYFIILNGRRCRKSWQGDVPPYVRHLFVQNYDGNLINEKVLRLKHLRTLIISVIRRGTSVEEKIIESICKKLPNLRILAFALSEEYDIIKEPKKVSIPESIGRLKHLRYFAFRTMGSCMVILPNTLDKLQHIQLLDFGEGHIMDFTFADLISLRHIFCSPNVEVPHIQRLVLLRTLRTFRTRNKQGCEVKQLRDLNKLRGRLMIGDLENVKSKMEALEANLAAKEWLTDVRLYWGDDIGQSPEVEAEVFDGLCPPVGLESLQIWNYKGSRYPYWMEGTQNGDLDLQQLVFKLCTQVGPPPQLVEAFPHLRVLDLWACDWDALPGNMQQLILLRELVIDSCYNIRSLPPLPWSVQNFDLHYCNYEFMESCKTPGHPNCQKVEHIPYKNINPFQLRPKRNV